MNKVLVPLLVVIVLAAMAWLQFDNEPEAPKTRSRPPAAINSVVLQLRDFTDQVSALGTLKAWESVDISASVSQIVTALGFEDGDQVEQGDILALLKQDSEHAALRELQARLSDAQRELRRLEDLAQRNQVAQNELDKSRTQEEIIRYKIEAVEARISDRTITAPFAGVLGMREVSAGALVTPGQRLTTLDDLSRMRLDFNVPATLLGFLSKGQAITARTPAFNRSFPGIISTIGARVDPVTRSVSARATLENPQQILRPGLLMEVTILAPGRPALLLPEESLISRSRRHFVWVITGTTAVRTEVEIGGRIPGWVEVVSGLSPGDRVVRDGVGKLSGDSAEVKEVSQP